MSHVRVSLTARRRPESGAAKFYIGKGNRGAKAGEHRRTSRRIARTPHHKRSDQTANSRRVTSSSGLLRGAKMRLSGSTHMIFRSRNPESRSRCGCTTRAPPRLGHLLEPFLQDAVAADPKEDRCLCHPVATRKFKRMRHWTKAQGVGLSLTRQRATREPSHAPSTSRSI
jgi:hypothetical protein